MRRIAMTLAGLISTAERRLYYMLGGGQAIRYAVGVGRPGFEWSGVRSIA